MPHANGRIYTETSGGVKYGISMYDIQATIGSSSPDIGSLCRSNNINKWAKFKPIRVDKQGVVTAAEMELANYGLSIPSSGFSSLDDMINGLSGADWVYLPPRGRKGTTLNPTQNDEPYRFLDFNGYNHGSVAPIYPLQSVVELRSPNETMDAGIGFGRNIVTQTEFLTLDDLRVDGHSVSDSFSEYYFGICAYNSSTYRYATTMSEKYGTLLSSLSEIGLSIQGVNVGGSTRTYRVIPFFSSLPFTTMPSNFVGSLYPMPFAECSLEVTRDYDIIYCYSLMFMYAGDTSKIYYQYKVTNMRNTPFTCDVNCWLLNSYNITDTYGSALRMDTGVSMSAQSSYTSPMFEITDGLLITNIINNVQYFGVEVRNGVVRTAYSISQIIFNADPNDPPYI